MKPALADAAAHNEEPAQGHDGGDPHAVPANCRNCGTATAGNYCSHCGQETRLHMPSFLEFAHEFVSHYVAVEGRLWGTFARLLFRPGALTNEYLAGRRRRYVEPLRLYLTLSILFFALMRFSGFDMVNFGDEPDPREPAAEVAEAPSATPSSVQPPSAKPPSAKPPSAAAPAGRADQKTLSDLQPVLDGVSPAVRASVDRFDKLDTKDKGKVLSDSFLRYAPYAMFCLMPVFALWLKMLYLGTGRRYGEHLLFALHTNAFAFVMFISIALAPEGFATFVLLCWLTGYLPWAMQRVYRKGRWGTFWRWSILTMLHMVSLSLAIAGATLLGAATVH